MGPRAQRGEKAELRAMAQRNAQEETERATTVEERTAYTLELLGKMLNLPEPPKRMESFDISNTGKSDIVALWWYTAHPAAEVRLPPFPHPVFGGTSG